MKNTNYYSDQEKDIRENDRDRDRGEGDRQDISLKKGKRGGPILERIHSPIGRRRSSSRHGFNEKLYKNVYIVSLFLF